MSTLSWSGAEIAWGEWRLAPTDACYEGERVLLFGDFRWLFALLVGRAELIGGSVECLGQDGRQARLAGRVGASPAALQDPPHWTVSRWVELNLELIGTPARDARRAVARVLEQLGLQALATRRVHELNGAEAFAAHAAFAASTSPELVVLSAPLLLPETRDFELSVIGKLASRSRLALACPRRDPELWAMATDFAYSANRAGARTTLPSELLEQSRWYRVVPLGPAPGFSSALEELGAQVEAAEDGSPLRVAVPSGGAELIVEAAQRAEVTLAELVSIPEAR
jgi:hypothetical protein